MKRTFGFVVAAIVAAIFFVLLFTSCRSPARRAQQNAEAIAKAKAAEQRNRDGQIDKASGLIFAARNSLDYEEKPSPPVSLAKEFADKAQAVIGPPDFADVAFYQTTIRGLLSTNEQLRASALRALAIKDAEIARLQTQLVGLKANTAKTETRRDKDYSSAAAEAETWVKLKRIFFWVSGIAIFIMLAKWALEFYAKFYGGGLAEFLFKRSPKVQEKFVTAEHHGLAEETLDALVTSIDLAKRTNPGVAATLDPILLDKTNDETTREKIREVKKRRKI